MTDCLFCKIVQGELPSTKVYEDERSLAFLDIHPVNPGHTLIVPKNHATNIFDIPLQDWLAVSNAVHLVAPALEKALGADGINLNMNNREQAGQVVHHPHVHVIPRFKNDGLKHWPHREYKESEAAAVAEKVRAALR